MRNFYLYADFKLVAKMIYGIKLDNEHWIGTDGWKEPIPAGVPEYVFATEDINKAYEWCKRWNNNRDFRYTVEVFDIEKEVEMVIRLKQR